MDGAKARRKEGRVGRARKGIGQPSSARRALPSSDARRPVKRRMRSWQTWDVERPEGMRIETRKNIGYKIFLLSSPTSFPLPPSRTRGIAEPTPHSPYSSLLLLFDPRNSGGKPRNNNFPRGRKEGEGGTSSVTNCRFLFIIFTRPIFTRPKKRRNAMEIRGWRGWSQFR